MTTSGITNPPDLTEPFAGFFDRSAVDERRSVEEDSDHISTVEISDADFRQRLNVLDALADEMSAADEGHEASTRRLLSARLAFAVHYRALYLAVERDGERVKTLRDKYDLGVVDGSRWSVIGERATDISHLVRMDDEYFSVGHLRVRTTPRTLYALAAALNRNRDAVLNTFHDPAFEPTVRALDAIGAPITEEPVEPELAARDVSDDDTTGETSADEDVAAAHRTPNEVGSKLTDYLYKLCELRESHEQIPAADYHDEAADVFQASECVASVVGYEFIKAKRVLRVVTDYEMNDLDWEMLHGTSSAHTRITCDGDDQRAVESLPDESDITEWMAVDSDDSDLEWRE